MPHVDGPLYALTASGLLMFKTGRQLWFAHVSQQWPRAPAKIMKSATPIVVSDVDVDPPAPAYAGWTDEFIYQYTVDYQTYTGARLRFTPFSFKEAKRAAARFIPEHGVRVAYNPAKPEMSVLVPGVTGLGIAAFVASLVPTVASLIWLAMSLW